MNTTFLRPACQVEPELAFKENVSWVWKSWNNKVLQPSEDRVLLCLSPGGSDACVVREFDLESKSIIPEEQGGFYVPEAKTSIDWRTKDTVFIGTGSEEAANNGLTDSGYPIYHISMKYYH